MVQGGGKKSFTASQRAPPFKKNIQAIPKLITDSSHKLLVLPRKLEYRNL